ncbi:hypothetical protein NGR_b16720 (plasmid) [Sinorhizobium fredii NGR234]|uniref:Integral membrane protein n=1 Tax=Sinorhizobium fredii (strain NBRC 101917 / NGR234) TaxID=394 RepID=Q6W221_SINFN|nr:hypothetical protein [Sinorhizobium fredii]AAQ87197.1 Hypothetical protein RNGR00175 [Sinorhizobium fredii NGR234]ACP23123.1 hypothetical protein NGR_b16720 [Sinorhizobium fredii NGR234]
MSTTVVALLVLAGLSESAGRVLPLVARRPKLSPRLVAGLMVTGTVVEGTVIALWPHAAWTFADLVQPVVAPDAAPLPATNGLAWTPVLVAPLLLAAVLAFPLLGPFLHILLVTGVGAGLASPLAGVSGLGWWPAAGCIAIAGVGLTATVEVVRRLIARIIAGSRQPEAIV